MACKNGIWSNAAGDSIIRNPCHPYWYRKVPNQHLRRRCLLLLNGSLHPKAGNCSTWLNLGFTESWGRKKAFRIGEGPKKRNSSLSWLCNDVSLSSLSSYCV